MKWIDNDHNSPYRCGAGFANDRPDAALALANDLAGRDGRRFLFFELLAERTLAEAQLRRLNDAQSGYALRLFDFRTGAGDLPGRRHRHRHQRRRRQPHRRRHAPAPAAAGTAHASARIACILGDDLLDSDIDLQQWLPAQLDGEVVSVNVYSGADGIVQALDQGADIVLCGRVADPSLAVGLLRHAFGWQADDGTASPRPRQSVTCSNAVPRSAVATSLIPA